MSDQRQGGIAWTEETWNPVRGCSRVSRGCERCYAERQAGRMAGPGGAYEGLVRPARGGFRWTGTVSPVLDGGRTLTAPLRWLRPRRVFVNSMSDLFHEALSDEAIADVFAVMAAATRHQFQVLTKRAARMREWAARQGGSGWPPPNVWLGVSVEDQASAEGRLPHLLATPAAVRWISYEPALGPVDFRPWLGQAPGVDWLVVGGESGPGARPCDVAWIRSAIRQCQGAGTPVFCKQLGALPYDLGGDSLSDDGTPPVGTLLDGICDRKGGDPSEWPEDLRIREMPAVGATGTARRA